MDGGAWWAAVHGVAKSPTQLRDFTFTFCFHTLEKEMATHSSVLAWRIPGTGEPGGLQSMGSHRVGHNWSDLAAAAAAACIQWALRSTSQSSVELFRDRQVRGDVSCTQLCLTQGLPGSSAGKESACSVGDLGSILEKGMATHSGTLAWRIPWTEEPGGGYSPWGRKESEQLSTMDYSLPGSSVQGIFQAKRWCFLLLTQLSDT